MKHIFDYIQRFKFKDAFAVFLIWRMLDILSKDPTLRDLLIVLITLIVKHFYDSNVGSSKKDETISTLANNQQTNQTPTVQNAETVKP